jgi:GTP cyclohydrolase II
MITEILIELRKRNMLELALDAIIETTYKYEMNSKKRLRRGAVHEQIFNALGVKRNNLLCNLINTQMKKRGYKLIINRGDQYFSNISQN